MLRRRSLAAAAGVVVPLLLLGAVSVSGTGADFLRLESGEDEWNNAELEPRLGEWLKCDVKSRREQERCRAFI